MEFQLKEKRHAEKIENKRKPYIKLHLRTLRSRLHKKLENIYVYRVVVKTTEMYACDNVNSAIGWELTGPTPHYLRRFGSDKKVEILLLRSLIIRPKLGRKRKFDLPKRFAYLRPKRTGFVIR